MREASNPVLPGTPSCQPNSTAATAAQQPATDRLSECPSDATETVEPCLADLSSADAQGVLTVNVQAMPMPDAHSMSTNIMGRDCAHVEHAMSMHTEHTTGSQNEQTVSRPDGHGAGRQIEQTSGIPEISREPELLFHASMAVWTVNELKILGFFQAHRHCRTNYRYLAREHVIPFGTVRRIVQRLVSAGYIRYHPFRDGSQQGIEVRYVGPERDESAEGCVDRNVGKMEYRNTPNGQATWAESEHPAHIEEREIERKKDLSIWNLSADQIEELWPHVKRAGLFASHLREVREALEIQGVEDKPGKLVALTLRYLDWQLAKGPLIDQHGKMVDNPIAYWRAAMKRNGYYQKPVGYEDPHDVYLREALEIEAGRTEMRRKQERLRQENEKMEREEALHLVLQALVEQGEVHPLWKEVFEQWTPSVRNMLTSSREPITKDPIVAAVTRAALRKIFGWTEEVSESAGH